MLRTFPEHTVRSVASLDRRWQFAPRNSDATPPSSYPATIQVPSAWELLPGFEAYRGQCWFRTTFTTTDPALAVRLAFGGVSHTADVFVDGRQVGHHYDAFTPFDIVLPPLAPGEHVLAVRVDNTFGEHSALHIGNDYYTYGGITRPVELQQLNPVFIDRLHFTPRPDGDAWALDATVRLRNLTGRSATVDVGLAIAGLDARASGEVTVPAGESLEVPLRLSALAASPWTPKTPVLYTAVATLTVGGAIVDDKRDRVGFRHVAVDGDRLLLNGQPLDLRGYNRHEDHPHFGCAIPLEAMALDLELMRDLGCNFVRTCHYPNDMRFLDLCDEMGFAVWEESHARTVRFAHPRFADQIADSTREMLDWHRNHPAIIIWGCLNECDSVSEDGRQHHLRVLGMLRELDGSRPVTFASNQGTRDICLDAVDIVSWNIYPGWYSGGLGDIAPTLDQLLAWLDSSASGGAGKPLIISEFGGGGIYGNRQRCRSKWSEEYQADLLDALLGLFCNHPRITGTAIWQFCDVRITEDERWWYGRPRTMNNKGTVDEFRRPKLAYDTVKHHYDG